MINLLANLKAFCVAGLSLCLGMIVLGSGLQAHAQETNAKVGDERRGEDSNKGASGAAVSYAVRECNNTASAEKASEWARSFKVLLFSAQAFVRPQADAIIHQGVRISGRGKRILFNATVSRQLAGELLTRNLSAT